MVKNKPRKEILDCSSDPEEPEEVKHVQKMTRRGPRFVARASSPPAPQPPKTPTPSPRKRRRELSPDYDNEGGEMDQPELPFLEPEDQGNGFIHGAGRKKSGYVCFY